MSLHNAIEEVFMEIDPIQDQPIDYVKCIDLTPVAKLTWKTHTNDRATLASLLSVCTHLTNNLRFCARKLADMYHVSLRRLEEYAKWSGFVLRGVEKWIGYGKLVEATLYYAYISPRRKRWERHIEIRLYFTIPIHFNAYDVLLRTTIDDLDEIAREIVDHWYGLELSIELDFDREESLKHGLRVITKDYVDMVEEYTAKRCPISFEPRTDAVHAPCCLTRYWCNEVVRSSYSYIQAIIVDYRQRVAGRHNYCYNFDKDELSFVNIESYIERWFRWW